MQFYSLSCKNVGDTARISNHSY